MGRSNLCVMNITMHDEAHESSPEITTALKMCGEQL
jgi:hypothetical protein